LEKKQTKKKKLQAKMDKLNDTYDTTGQSASADADEGVKFVSEEALYPTTTASGFHTPRKPKKKSASKGKPLPKVLPSDSESTDEDIIEIKPQKKKKKKVKRVIIHNHYGNSSSSEEEAEEIHNHFAPKRGRRPTAPEVEFEDELEYEEETPQPTFRPIRFV
jgi:hypothetical protein